MHFNGCRFAAVNAISECFTSTGAFYEDDVAFAPDCEGQFPLRTRPLLTGWVKGQTAPANVLFHCVATNARVLCSVLEDETGQD